MMIDFTPTSSVAGQSIESTEPIEGAGAVDVEAVLDTGLPVEQLADGDTISLRSGSRRLRVRLLGIDAPELHFQGQGQLPWGDLALRQLMQLAPPGTRVRLVADRERLDQYGRLLCYVLRGSLNLNVEMVRLGWAVAYQIYPNLGQLVPIQRANVAAQAARRGIWDPRRLLPELPYEFRRRIEGRPSTKFCGDSETHRYYPPDQYRRVPIARRIFFFSEDDARKYGFLPAAMPRIDVFAESVAPRTLARVRFSSGL